METGAARVPSSASGRAGSRSQVSRAGSRGPRVGGWTFSSGGVCGSPITCVSPRLGPRGAVPPSLGRAALTPSELKHWSLPRCSWKWALTAEWASLGPDKTAHLKLWIFIPWSVLKRMTQFQPLQWARNSSPCRHLMKCFRCLRTACVAALKDLIVRLGPPGRPVR